MLIRLLILLAITLTLAGTASAQCGGAGQLPCTLGWFQISGTTPQNACPPAATYPDIQGTTGCSAVTRNWGGGWIDTVRGQLRFWGGGHADYWGNELYSLNLTANPITLTRLNEPSRNPGNPPTCGSGAYPDGKPCSRHTYDYLAYSPTADVMINFSGSLPPDGSFCKEDIWRLNSSSLAWTSQGSGNWDCNSVYVGADYDPNSDSIFFADDHNIFRYNTTTNIMTNVGGAYTQRSGQFADGFSSMVIDPSHKLLFVMGGGDRVSNGNFYKFDISNPNSVPSPVNISSAAGCSTWSGANAYGGPGLAWYPTRRAVAIWAGGNSIGLYDPVANNCSTVTFSGGPTAQAHGTFGRFRYVSQLGVFALVTDYSTNSYVLRIDDSATASFADRCAKLGVLNCQGFDNSSLLSQQVNFITQTDGFNTLGNSNDIIDSTNFSSGTGSLNLHIPANTGQNCCANWFSYFGQGAANHPFGANSDWYIQYQFRADPTWVSSNWMSDSGSTWPKTVIFHSLLPGAGGVPGSCANEELTTINYHILGAPTAYTECGARLLWTCTDAAFTTGCGTQDMQSGWTAASPFTGYQCGYNNGLQGPDCFKWAGNVWYTTYWHVHIGSFGTSPVGDSTVEAWIGPYGQQMRKWMNLRNFPFISDPPGNCNGISPCPGFNVLELTQFMTNHAGTNSVANVWYDELIESTTPICPTGGVSPDNLIGCPSGVAPAQGTPSVSLAPTSLSFGNQPIQVTSSSQNVTLTNTGSASLTINSITLTGANPGDYAISSNNCGGSLGAGISCIVGVTFRPTIVGSRTASLTFSTNAASSPDNVPLTGTGQAPVASFNPVSLNFGGIKVGLSSSSQPVTLTNTGNAIMSITSITITGANPTDFSQGNNCGSTLGVGLSCTINVTFTPLLQGTRSANVSLTSNTVTSPDSMTLVGIGFNPISGTGTLSGTGTIRVQP